jgi:hypothetical protein
MAQAFLMDRNTQKEQTINVVFNDCKCRKYLTYIIIIIIISLLMTLLLGPGLPYT